MRRSPSSSFSYEPLRYNNRSANLPSPKSSSSAERGEMNMLVHHDLGFSHRACDRCHGQKLRCRRDGNNGTCIRCAKAGAHCTPRLTRPRPRADSTSGTQKQRQSRPHGDRDREIPRQLPAVPERDPNESDKGKPNDFHPLNYLNSSTDINLGFDSSLSQVTELHPALAPCYGTPATDSQGRGRRASQQSSTQPPSRSGTTEQPGQTRWDGASGRMNPDFLYDMSSTSPTALSLFHSSEHHMSPPRDMSLSCTNQQAPFSVVMAFDETVGQSKSLENKDQDTDLGYRNDLSPSDLLQSPDNEALDSSSEDSSQEMDDIADLNPNMYHSTMTSWIRGLSGISVQLFQHMHSIPTTDTEKQRAQSSYSGCSSTAGSGSGSGGGGHARLAVDCTFRLAAQYTELLTNLCTLLKSHGACHDAHAPTSNFPVLDEPSLCIVLSSYMYLLESYYKILQRMKTWMENTSASAGTPASFGTTATVVEGPTINLGCSMDLPGLAVGSFKAPKASPISPIVLACIVDTNVRHTHSLIGIIVSLASDSTSKTGNSGGHTPLGEGSDGPSDRLPGVAKAIMQAVKGKEDSTLKLVPVVSQLALKYFTVL